MCSCGDKTSNYVQIISNFAFWRWKAAIDSISPHVLPSWSLPGLPDPVQPAPHWPVSPGSCHGFWSAWLSCPCPSPLPASPGMAARHTETERIRHLDHVRLGLGKIEHTETERIQTDLLFMSVSAFSFYHQWLNTQKLRESKRISCSCLSLLLVFTSSGWTHRNRMKTDLLFMSASAFSFYQQWLNTQKQNPNGSLVHVCFCFLVFTSNGWTHRNWENPNGSLVHVCLCF